MTKAELTPVYPIYTHKDQIVDACRRFPWLFNKNVVVDEKRGHFDQKIITFFDDLHNGSFWHVLGQLDGYPKETPTEQEARKAWARKTFANFELNELFQLSVATAILRPFGTTGHPGGYGYSGLFANIIQKPNSMFRNKFNDEQVKILQNGRFWEQLTRLDHQTIGNGFPIVEDILRNHSEDLSLDFVPKGMEIFTRENTGFILEYWDLDISYQAFDKLARFFDSIYVNREKLGVDKQVLDKIFEKIILRAFNPKPRRCWDTNMGETIPLEGKALDLLKGQLKLPSFEDYLEDKKIKKALGNMITNQTSGYNTEKLLSVIKNQTGLFVAVKYSLS